MTPHKGQRKKCNKTAGGLKFKRKRDMKATSAANGNNFDGDFESIRGESSSRFYPIFKGFKIPESALILFGFISFIAVIAFLGHLSSTNISARLANNLNSTDTDFF
jgi:hypothetical protein